MSDLLDVLSTATATGSGLVGGVLLAFSTSVLPGLRDLDDAAAVTAMQRFNARILNPVFLTAFAGTAALGVATGVVAALDGGAWTRVAGATAYVVGVFGLTAAVNVPLNQRLEGLTPGSSEATAFWPGFRRRWGRANVVRTVAAAAAAVLLAA